MKTIYKLRVKRERTSLVADGDTVLGKKIAHSGDAAKIFHALLADEVGEVFLLLHLDVRNAVVGYSEIARGTLTSCNVTPDVVLRAALLSGAVGFIVSHNHPSGDPSPSTEDIALTKRLRAAFKLVGLELLDHVIVAQANDGPASMSFLDHGLLQ